MLLHLRLGNVLLLVLLLSLLQSLDLLPRQSTCLIDTGAIELCARQPTRVIRRESGVGVERLFRVGENRRRGKLRARVVGQIEIEVRPDS